MAEHSNSRATELPIGVFDSGLGGLTVVREIRNSLPAENIVYLGDSARVPYGTRSSNTVVRYAWNCADFLVAQGLKMLVVACNTASAVALPSLRRRIDVPVQGVISAGARAAVSVSKTGRVGVIGTAGTIGSGAYPTEINGLDANFQVFQNAAPLLVPLAEEGWTSGQVPSLAIRHYLEPLVQERIDVLLLGCTHYPILTDSIRHELSELGSDAMVVDSATAMSGDVADALAYHKLLRQSDGTGSFDCYVTDLPGGFNDVAGRFLGGDVGAAKKVDIT